MAPPLNFVRITISHKDWGKGSLGKVRTKASTSVGGQLIPVVTLEAQAAGHAQSLNVRIDASAPVPPSPRVSKHVDPCRSEQRKNPAVATRVRQKPLTKSW